MRSLHQLIAYDPLSTRLGIPGAKASELVRCFGGRGFCWIVSESSNNKQHREMYTQTQRRREEVRKGAESRGEERRLEKERREDRGEKVKKGEERRREKRGERKREYTVPPPPQRRRGEEKTRKD